MIFKIFGGIAMMVTGLALLGISFVPGMLLGLFWLIAGIGLLAGI